MSIKHVREVLKQNDDNWMTTDDIKQACQQYDRPINVQNSLRRMRRKYNDDPRLTAKRDTNYRGYRYKWTENAEAKVTV